MRRQERSTGSVPVYGVPIQWPNMITLYRPQMAALPIWIIAWLFVNVVIHTKRAHVTFQQQPKPSASRTRRGAFVAGNGRGRRGSSMAIGAQTMTDVFKGLIVVSAAFFLIVLIVVPLLRFMVWYSHWWGYP